MPDAPQRVYWDACVFLSYVNGVADRLPSIDALFEDARTDKIQIVTSVLSIAEVAFGAQEQAGKALDLETEEKINGLWNDPVATIAEFHSLIAAEAVQLMRAGIPNGWSLKAADAIHLATAKRVGAAKFHTYDEALKKWATVVGLPVEEPQPEQGRLIE